MDWLKPGTKASDYQCPARGFWFQLKSKKSPIGQSIRDGAYRAMMEAIQQDRAPSFFFLHYDLATWSVRNLLLVPYFAFPPSAIIKCPPLSATARRAGWIGCNFNLSRIPQDARIAVVVEKHVTPATEVREKFQKVKPLKELSVKERGWTLDVLNVVAAVCDRRKADAHRAPLQDWKEFTNADVYAYQRELEALHPDNRHVRDKIRQQLQILRDAKLLIHVGSGVWRLP